MKAFRYFGPGNAEVVEMDRPVPGPGEVLIAMQACGICGTDIKTFMRGHPKIPAGAVLGHEVAGQIVASNAAGFREGDRVVVAPYAPCRACAMCQRGHFSLCENLSEAFLEPGGFAEFIRVPERLVQQGLLHIPDELDAALASLAEPLACCVHGLEALNLQAGQSLLIIGDGPMGLLQAALGRAWGAAPIVVTGLVQHRLEFAHRVADVVIDVSKAVVGEAVRQVLPEGADNVMVSVGDVAVAQEVLPLARTGGAINLFAGMPRNSMLTLDSSWIHYHEVTLLGTFGFAPAHFRQALDLLASGQVRIDDSFFTTVMFDGLREALADASQYKGIKTIVLP